ncbi:MAG: hypothetical protein OXM54_04695 [Acidimicrobiaceae bacterium]|nr:hypothetical protein [Acidimicrobiaceae bacterium]
MTPDPQDPDVWRVRWSDGATLPDDLELLAANVRAEHGGRLDVLFAHDTPAPAPGMVTDISRGPLDIHAASATSRALVADAVKLTQPQMVLHRIWGDASRDQITQRTEAIGLAASGRSRSRALLTLSDPPRAEYP